ncbi:DUF3298 and DUF4163 domain-containing protein [Paraurantiacibacter namhicola]|uniref:Deacetylase PdaC domain-containing protein n=1 Tax=Paraurantiacibacter namhicola TaxID=645517 RepID=A0A1C7DAQ3_9SPHN|nr:DUF3298 and DUF4163 domain-containing protein [Paraurantiacibacter namhicola]ANU08566.1 hypothetical protein A6F65_02283 [Paraurantiacibacter namhicola]
MRHFVSVFAGVGAAFSMAGCGGSTGAETDQGSASATSTAASSGEGGTVSSSTKTSTSSSTSDGDGRSEASSTSRSSGAFATSQETDRYIFEYSWPAAAGSIPALDAMLTARMEKERDQLQRYAAEAARDAKADDIPFFQHSSYTEWEVAANTPRFLSLFTGVSTYAGGAHPNLHYDAILWDKQAGKALAAGELFKSRSAFENRVSGPMCDALDAQREERRGMKVERGSGGMFEDCPALEDVVITFASSGGTAFDRINFLFAPYVAGPYAEGTFEVTLPMTAALLDMVKPQYREAFAVRR